VWNVYATVGNLAICFAKESPNPQKIRLVQVLSGLHNFCIEKWDGDLHSCDFASLKRDPDGYVSLVRTEQSNRPVPLQLLDGGNHFEP
jgi:hypothetical protein